MEEVELNDANRDDVKETPEIKNDQADTEETVDKWAVVKILLKDVSLTIADVISDFYNVYSLYKDRHYQWSAISLILIWIPGLLMLIWIFFRRITGTIDSKLAFTWAILSGPFFPLWVTYSYGKSMWYMKNKEKFKQEYVYAIFFKALEGIAEAAPQLLLNIYIALTKSLTLSGILSMVFSFLSITKTASENHFIEISNIIPTTRQILWASPFFGLHVMYRVLVLGVLAAYLKHYVMLFLLITILLNVIWSRRLLCTHPICTFWASVASVFSCTMFKHIEQGVMKGPGSLDLPQTLLYYLLTSLSFFIVSITGVIITGRLLCSGFLNTHQLPKLNCIVSGNETLAYNLQSFSDISSVRYCSQGESPNDVFEMVVVPFLGLLGMLTVAAAFTVWMIASKTGKNLKIKIKSFKTGEYRYSKKFISARPSFLATGSGIKSYWEEVTIIESDVNPAKQINV